MANKKEENKLPTKEELEDWAKKVVKNSGTDTGASNPEKVPQKKSVILLVFLSIITLGIYPAIWYIKRAPELNDLHTEKQIGKGLTKTYATFAILLIISIAIFYLFPRLTNMGGATPEDIILTTSLSLIGLSALLSFIIAIILAFKTRAILNLALDKKGIQRKPSILFTIIFNMFYLQYEINRILDDKEMERRTGPWIFFILWLILIIAPAGLFLAGIFTGIASNF